MIVKVRSIKTTDGYRTIKGNDVDVNALFLPELPQTIVPREDLIERERSGQHREPFQRALEILHTIRPNQEYERSSHNREPFQRATENVQPVIPEPLSPIYNILSPYIFRNQRFHATPATPANTGSMNRWTNMLFSYPGFDEQNENLMFMESFNLSQPVRRPLNNIESLVISQAKAGDRCLSEKCAVCMDNILINENIITLSCNHTFHDLCIKGWFNEKDTCPICRAQAMQSVD